MIILRQKSFVKHYGAKKKLVSLLKGKAKVQAKIGGQVAKMDNALVNVGDKIKETITGQRIPAPAKRIKITPKTEQQIYKETKMRYLNTSKKAQELKNQVALDPGGSLGKSISELGATVVENPGKTAAVVAPVPTVLAYKPGTGIDNILSKTGIPQRAGGLIRKSKKITEPLGQTIYNRLQIGL